MRLLSASRQVDCLTCLLCLCIAVSESFPTQHPASNYAAEQHQQRPRDHNTTSPDRATANATITWAVMCVYPVSGIYTRMQRILFYGAMVFVFLLRTHGWLVAVGLTFILTYSSAACIHAILLSTLSRVGPDLDILVLQGFVGVVTFAGFCYSFYSTRMTKHTIAPLFYSWTVFALATFLIVLCSPNGITATDIANFIVAADCNVDGKCDASSCNNSRGYGVFRSGSDQLVPEVLEPLIYYNTSSGASIWDFGNSTSRLNGQVPSSATSTSNNPPYARAMALDQTYSSALSWFLKLSGPVLMPIVSNLIHTSSRSRNLIFVWILNLQVLGLQLLTGCDWGFTVLYLWNWLWRRKKASETAKFDTHWPWKSFPESSKLSKRHINFARLMASCWFIWAALGRFVLPVLPFAFLAVVEWSLTGLPESEAPWQVGQWAPLVSVGLALLAAIIMKLILYLRSNGQHGRRNILLNDPASARLLKTTPAGSIGYRNLDRLHMLVPAWKEFTAWWRDPVDISRQDWEETQREMVRKREKARQEKQSRQKQKQERKRNAKTTSPFYDDTLEFGHIFCKEIPRDADFQDIWKRLSVSAVKPPSHRSWSRDIPCTFDICRVGSNGSSLSAAGWITTLYENEGYEQLSDKEFERRKRIFNERIEARERIAAETEPYR